MIKVIENLKIRISIFFSEINFYRFGLKSLPKKQAFLFFALMPIVLAVHSREYDRNKRIITEPTVCYASEIVEKSFIPPPQEVVDRLKSGKAKKSQIIVTYSLFPANARAAFQYAVNIWENIIESPVPIYMQASWRSKSANVLGSCSTNDFFSNFKYAPRENRFYPSTIVEKITKKEVTGSGTPDMTAEFNKDIKWYYGTDGNTPDSLYDLVTVVLHEIGHGLGMTGFFNGSGSTGFYARSNLGEASAFDLLVVQNSGTQLLDTAFFKNSTVNLKNALISNNLFAMSPIAIDWGSGTKPRLYAPTTWDSGSSIYHLNDATYLKGNMNSLMTHAIGKGEAIHDPGPITQGIMDDMGWKNIYIDFTPVNDFETLKPLIFNVKIESDYDIDPNGLFLYVSTNGFKTKPDSIKLTPSSVSKIFTATYTPSVKGTVSYYIKVSDIKNRIYKLPTEAPRNFYKFIYGPDVIPPVITHTSIPFYLNTGKKLEVVADVTDNVGVDSVFVEYSINGIAQTPFGLKRDTATFYKGNFNFDNSKLKDNDEISYRIVARDNSTARNTSINPSKENYKFKVEQMFPPVRGYINNFNNPTSDFITTDFKIFTEQGFADGALHSAHPYVSPKKDNTYLEFISILKRPVILVKNYSITFDEVVLVEPGENGALFGSDNFWDYVIVEGSKDRGSSWKPLADGYDSNSSSIWLTSYNSQIVDQSSKSVGKKEMFINRTINPLKNGNFTEGDTILIRFRLHSDPYANGWGWAIDNLRIQFPVDAPVIKSAVSVLVYPNPFNNSLKTFIELDELVKNFQIEVFNSFGQKVKTIQKRDVSGTFTEEIDFSEVAAGIYFLTIKKEGKIVFSEKIIRKQ